MKKVDEYSDRELMEKMALYSKTTSESIVFIKNYIIVTTILAFFLAISAIF